MKKLKPLHLYLIFIIVILLSRFFESKIPWLYYLMVVVGFVFFFLAVKKYFKK